MVRVRVRVRVKVRVRVRVIVRVGGQLGKGVWLSGRVTPCTRVSRGKDWGSGLGLGLSVWAGVQG